MHCLNDQKSVGDEESDFQILEYVFGDGSRNERFSIASCVQETNTLIMCVTEYYTCE